MFDELRDYVSRRIVKLLEVKVSGESAVEIEKKMSYEDKRRILKEFESNGRLSEETYKYILSKFYYKDLTSVLFGISSDIVVHPEITNSLIGSGKFGLEGLRKHVRELRYSEENFEEILLSVYNEIRKRADKKEEYKELLATACVEIGSFYLDKDYKKAEKFLLEAYDLRFTLYGNSVSKKLGEAIVELGSRYLKIKKFEKAEILFEKAFSFLKELSEKSLLPEREFASAVLDLANFYIKMGNSEKALELHIYAFAKFLMAETDKEKLSFLRSMEPSKIKEKAEEMIAKGEISAKEFSRIVENLKMAKNP